jgi:hypothetical protein
VHVDRFFLMHAIGLLSAAIQVVNLNFFETALISSIAAFQTAVMA